MGRHLGLTSLLPGAVSLSGHGRGSRDVGGLRLGLGVSGARQRTYAERFMNLMVPSSHVGALPALQSLFALVSLERSEHGAGSFRQRLAADERCCRWKC